MLAEAEDESLKRLQYALTQTNNSVAQANLQLAINLHKRYQAEQQKYHQELSQQQQALSQANMQYTLALQSQSKDISKLHKPPKEFRRRRGDRERLEFSNMMVEGAQRRVQRAEIALKRLVEDKEEHLRKLRVEVRLAEQACRGVLQGAEPDRLKPAVPAVPAMPAVRPPVPQTKSSRSAASKMQLPPPPPPPPPLLPPLPRVTITPAPPQASNKPATRIKPAKNTLFPQDPAPKDAALFTIENEDRQQSSLVTSQQRRLQGQIPQQLLVQLDAIENPQDMSADHMSRKLFKEMWPHIHKVLQACFVGHREGQVRLIRGCVEFGADAYLELASNQQLLIRVPLCIVGGNFNGTAGQLPGIRVQKKSKSEQAILMSFGPSIISSTSAVGWQKAACAVLYTVKLISTEARAKNAGILVTPYGLLFVRRTRRQAALVSHLYPFANSKPCHPLVAIGWFVAQLLATSSVEMKPPCIGVTESLY
ncbi:hypothetical protein IWW42_002800 [Coemansia sp. RSA 1085]|nr:hypothetical protein IWW42_002800 [Coemansia sp. RSA 1085]